MRETTAEIWIGPDQSNGWYSTQGGINPTHLMLLRENDHPAWLLLPGNLQDLNLVIRGPHPVWIPTQRALDDALLMLAVLVVELPSVCEMFKQLGGNTDKNQVNLASLFPDGVPEALYQECKTHLRGRHLVVSASRRSLVMSNVSSLPTYSGLNIDVRLTVSEFSTQLS